ncbi:hypothetical protein LCGC14_2791770 [marine sediment metagenome]|uniref:Uncharacterized protein n=1 Tax=marine sediment metagenome TaxID=412755 RepID=A0A0F8YQ93_9ZZZZ
MVTATLSRPKSLTETLLPMVLKRAERGLKKAAALVPDFLKDNFIDQGTRGKSGQNRWARVSRRQIIWRVTYPHGGSPEQKDAYWRAHKPLNDTGRLRKSFAPGPIAIDATGMAVKVTSSTDYGWRHHFGEGFTPDGQPIWRRPHMYIVDPVDTDKMYDAFALEMVA